MAMDEEKLTKAQIKEQRHKERQEWEAKMAKQVKFGQYKRLGIWAIAGVLTLLCVWGLISLVNTSPTSQDLTLTAPEVTKTDLSLARTMPKQPLLNMRILSVLLVKPNILTLTSCKKITTVN